MFHEDDLLPISALQHLLFCPRQCALIHNEQSWEENRLTAEGRVMHQAAESGKSTTRDGVRITRDLPLMSLQYGLAGKADIVEFRPPAGLPDRSIARTLKTYLHQQRDVSLEGWTILPVEYKRGQPKENDCDRVQLCAQTLCLEEMLSVTINQGALFYGQKKHRHEVVFDAALREKTIQTAAALHVLIESGETPRAEYEKKCDSCSLYPLCLPKTLGQESVHHWIRKHLEIKGEA